MVVYGRVQRRLFALYQPSSVVPRRAQYVVVGGLFRLVVKVVYVYGYQTNYSGRVVVLGGEVIYVLPISRSKVVRTRTSSYIASDFYRLANSVSLQSRFCKVRVYVFA